MQQSKEVSNYSDDVAISGKWQSQEVSREQKNIVYNSVMGNAYTWLI